MRSRNRIEKPRRIRERECLVCGAHRPAPSGGVLGTDECPRCGYVGWTDPQALTPAERELLHRTHRYRR